MSIEWSDDSNSMIKEEKKSHSFFWGGKKKRKKNNNINIRWMMLMFVHSFKQTYKDNWQLIERRGWLRNVIWIKTTTRHFYDVVFLSPSFWWWWTLPRRWNKCWSQHVHEEHDAKVYHIRPLVVEILTGGEQYLLWERWFVMLICLSIGR